MIHEHEVFFANLSIFVERMYGLVIKTKIIKCSQNEINLNICYCY